MFCRRLLLRDADKRAVGRNILDRTRRCAAAATSHPTVRSGISSGDGGSAVLFTAAGKISRELDQAVHLELFGLSLRQRVHSTRGPVAGGPDGLPMGVRGAGAAVRLVVGAGCQRAEVSQ